MKRFYIIIFLTALFATTTGNMTAAERELDSMWDRANTMYINADYTGAIAVYDSILNSGYSSTKLYYNLGNAYFKAGQNGKAIVYYNKALALSPTDADTKYNLAVANSFVKDEIAEIPTFFLVKWLRSVRDLLGSNAWAIISLIALGCALCGLLFYLLPEKKSLRQIGFWGGLTMGLIFILTASFAAIEKHERIDSSHAIIINSAVSVKSSPDNSSTDIFILHEGTKVKITNQYGDWSEIAIPNGSKGWLLNSVMETI